MSEDEVPGISVALTEISSLFRPLVYAVEQATKGNPRELKELLDRCGMDKSELDETLTAVETELETIVDSWNDFEAVVLEIRQMDPKEIVDIDITDVINRDVDAIVDVPVSDIPDTIDNIFEALENLDELSYPEVNIKELGKALLAVLVVDHLEKNHQTAYGLLRSVGVIRDVSPPPEIRLDKLPEAITDPNESATEVVGWGEEYFQAALLLDTINTLVERRLFTTYLGSASEDRLEPFVDEEVLDNPESLKKGIGANLGEYIGPAQATELTIPIFTQVGDVGAATAGLKIMQLPADDDHPLPGLAILPYGNLELDEQMDLGSGWAFKSSIAGEFGAWGLALRPDSDSGVDAEVVGLEDGEPPGEAHAEAALEYDPTEDADAVDAERVLMGTPGGTRLGLRSVSISASAEYEDDGFVMKAGLPVRARFVVSPDSFDNFLGKVLPDDGLRADFELLVGWSTAEGVYFGFGGGLEIDIPLRRELGPVTLDAVHLAVAAEQDEDTVSFAGGLSATFELGPITGTVRDVGLAGELSFPESSDGDIGPLAIDQSFDPPSGVGLDIDAGALRGGGFLHLEPEHNRYAGALELTLGDIELTAVGLLKTELPDGSSGFSLLVIIAGEFPPIQLSFGFTLNGVGGLLGINRKLNRDGLIETVKSGQLDSVLFPEDVVENADRIVSDLRSIFPPESGQHVVGPMVKLGWGTPQIITAELGVVLQLPDVKIAILGRLSVVLPDPDAELIALNLDAAGVIYPEEQLIEITAELFDSHIVGLPVSGGMAMRLRGGDNPQFLFSVGGFHPEFEPPGDFEEPPRLAITIGEPGDSLFIEITNYYAMTSNTVQYGSSYDLHGDFGPAEVEAYFALDALFQFDPFMFRVDVAGGIEVRIWSTGFSLEFEGTITGPNPFTVDGEVEVSLGLASKSVSVSASFGSEDDESSLPPSEILPELIEALEREGNWSAQRPERGDPIGPLRETETEAVLVHPLGSLSVRQTIVPLETDIETFGNAEPAGPTYFAVTEIAVESESQTLADPTEEKFAPDEYFDLDEDEQLDAPAFEPMPAGYPAENAAGIYDGGEDEHARADNSRTEQLVYRTYVEDERNDTYMWGLEEMGVFAKDEYDWRDALATEQYEAAAAFDSVGGVARGAKRETGTERFRPTGAKASDEDDEGGAVDGGVLSGSVTLAESTFVVATTDTMEPVHIPGAEEPTSKGGAKRALGRYLEDHPEREHELHVVATRRLDQ